MSSPTEPQLTITRLARDLGFARVGFARAERFDGAALALAEWLGEGMHGEMDFLASAQDRSDPRALMEGARTIVVVALPTRRPAHTDSRDGIPRGRVAAYALGQDYHRVFRRRLASLAAAIEHALGTPVRTRSCVDSAPLLEREAARRAAIAFTGKSTMSIAPGLGTFFLLGELLLDIEVPASAPLETSGCGTCTLCLDACPTAAFPGPYRLDARRCVSYLTIEHRGPIPTELRRAIGDRVFGCDECQTACPFNGTRKAPDADRELAARPELERLDLVDLLELGSNGHRRLVEGTALTRVSRNRLARNAAIALGNARDPTTVAPLARALDAHPSALVRQHAAWALGQIGGDAALHALHSAAARDPSEAVRSEARNAISGSGASS